MNQQCKVNACGRLGAWLTAVLILLGLCLPRARAVPLGGKQVPKDKFIVFVFVGHSNMDSRDRSMVDNVIHPRCWYRSNKTEEWIPAQDSITPHEDCSCPGHLFIRMMAEAYPDYHFGMVKVTSAGGRCPHYMKGGEHYEELKTLLEPIRGEVTFGGLCVDLGFAEANWKKFGREDAENFQRNAPRARADLRELIGEPRLPVVWGRYEMHGSRPTGYKEKLHRWILQLPETDPVQRTVVRPKEFVPRKLYTDAWHYSRQGYEIWAREAIRVYQERGWDAWAEDGPVLRAGEIPVHRWPESYRAVCMSYHRIMPRAMRMVHVEPHGNAGFADDHAMRLRGGHFRVVLPPYGRRTFADQLARYMQKQSASFQMILRPRGVQRGRILTVVDEGTERIAVDQDGAALTVAVEGEDPVRLCELTPGRKQHVILTFDGGKLTAYLNGEPAGGAPFPSPEAKQPVLVFGADAGGKQPWRGTIAHLLTFEFRNSPDREVGKLHRKYTALHPDNEPQEGLAARTDGQADVPDWPVDRRNMVLFWESNDNARLEVPGTGQVFCRIDARGLARLTRHHGMNLGRGWFELSDEDAARVSRALSADAAWSLEMTAAPAQAPASEARTLFSWGSRAALEQRGRALGLRVSSGGDADKSDRLAIGKLAPGRPQHLVLVAEDSRVACYVDGELSGRARLAKGVELWQGGPYRFGTTHGERFWRGAVDGVTIRARALSAREVRTLHRANHERIAGRRPAPRAIVRATLMEKSFAKGPRLQVSDAYPRVLIVHRYRVDKVLRGELDDKQVLVAHWAVLDQKPVPGAGQRKVGSTVRLVLEPFEEHPEAAADQRIESIEGGFALPLMLDVGPPVAAAEGD